MEHFPDGAGFAQGGSGINAGYVGGTRVYAELLASISKAKAELRANNKYKQLSIFKNPS